VSVAEDKITGVAIGRLVGLAGSGQAIVNLAGLPGHPLIARSSAVPLERNHMGRDVAVMFEGGNPEMPLILGLIEDLSSRSVEAKPSSPVALELDGESVVFTAEKQIVLRCGQSSITLARDGRVILRGAHVQSRSTGVNRIQGASVRIN
jgi:hypothetical protein